MDHDLIFSKYELYSVQYIICPQRIQKMISDLKNKTPNLLIDQLSAELDKLIEKECYFNLVTNRVDDFIDKFKRNVKIAQRNQDSKYLAFLARKFHIADDLEKINPDTWLYKSTKTLIKLKPVIKQTTSGVSPIGHNGTYKAKKLLSQILNISEDTVFKYKIDLIKLIHKYIHDHKLQGQSTLKATIFPNDELRDILLPLENDDAYTYYNLPNYLKHLIKQE